MSLTENYADMEDTHPMWAHQLQEMLDLGWEPLFPAVDLSSPRAPCYKQTFRKVK